MTDPRRLTVARRHVLISIQPINSSLFTDKASFLPQTYRRENLKTPFIEIFDKKKKLKIYKEVMEELHGIIGRKVTEQKKLHLYLEELRDIGTFQELSIRAHTVFR